MAGCAVCQSKFLRLINDLAPADTNIAEGDIVPPANIANIILLNMRAMTHVYFSDILIFLPLLLTFTTASAPINAALPRGSQATLGEFVRYQKS